MNGPRVTPLDIEQNIKSEVYFTAHQGARASFLDHAIESMSDPVAVLSLPDELRLMTICVLVLKNGFTVIGTSACAYPENFDAAFGQKLAREKAVEQIWPLMGYELKTKLASDPSYGQAASVSEPTPTVGEGHEAHDIVGTGEAEAGLADELQEYEGKIK